MEFNMTSEEILLKLNLSSIPVYEKMLYGFKGIPVVCAFNQLDDSAINQLASTITSLVKDKKIIGIASVNNEIIQILPICLQSAKTTREWLLGYNGTSSSDSIIVSLFLFIEE
jgi:hypothetical protein